MKMRKILLVGLLAIFFVACVTIPPVVRIKGRPAPRISIESITFYRNTEIKEADKEKISLIFSEIRDDELAHKTSEVFKRVFLERLKNNEIEVVEAVPYRIKASLGYMVEKGAISETWLSFGQVVLLREDGEKLISVFEESQMKKNFILVKAFTFFPEAQEQAVRLGNIGVIACQLADTLAHYFNDKEE